MDLPEALSALDALAGASSARLPRRYRQARALLETPDYLAFEEHDEVERARGRGDVESLVAWVRRQVEPRSVPRIWLARAARVAIAMVAAAALFGLGVRR